MIVFAIDPGCALSAYCMTDENAVPMHFDKVPNEDLIPVLRSYAKTLSAVVIERVASYGMPVGREVFETCEWIGRYTQIAVDLGIPVEYVFRQEEKLSICHSPKATDTTIRKALIDRFAKHDFKTGKGIKSNPDFFYGFRADCWSAFAISASWLSRKKYIEL